MWSFSPLYLWHSLKSSKPTTAVEELDRDRYHPVSQAAGRALCSQMIGYGAEGETRTHVGFPTAYKTVAIAAMRLQRN